MIFSTNSNDVPANIWKENRCTYIIIGKPSLRVTEGFCIIQQSGTGDSLQFLENL